VGGFSDMKDTSTPFGSSLENILLEKLAQYSFPVCFQFPVSHEEDNVALQVGMTYELRVGKTVTLKKCP
jgi:muramoyltetrapeptide carboxypeptidase